MQKEEKPKFAMSMYDRNGFHRGSTYSDDLYWLLGYYVFEAKKTSNHTRPVLWMFNGERYVRIHDFQFPEITKETYARYLEERILETDDLLETVER